MTGFLSILTVAATLATAIVETKPAIEKEVEPPAHQVIAIYFHRTQRCPTCKRIGALAEEAIRRGFPKEIKTRVVEYRLVDFQDKKNTKLVKQYGINTPTLVLSNVFDGEVVRATSMPTIWQLVGKPEEFQAYVQDGVTKYLKQTRKAAESKE
ncbi:nitrophenyl compound nitroreductase subunit ArsF family protein [Bythopirellula polymerisocia]|uniref:Thioredoxin domain-containing protein n=1 Tax=Bythopirellula polymerisocia TaxID=2528003 RepID=A0A5C6D0W8_9BACT|nr:nitrophenyl compound nitroreductase subunit ArsF family protein [Bythopirellula polymerisocia]TWU30520.1 hypothetical protein Pla144_13070 [Bythopirellula polymerisocia]